MNRIDPPFIPNSAPFTEAQRSYLNGFLAGIFSTNAQVAECDPDGQAKSQEPVTILWGSQTGNTGQKGRENAP